ncbi:MAG: acetyl-CoA acetyltransferase, partial [Acidimicrobiia bacterium]|nr:acetyl-CoA acetyltransferase [Acidimicrobiia bacterium]
MTRRVAIVGAALTDTGRVDDKTVWDLHYQGVTRALADAGLNKDDVQGLCSCGTGQLPPVELGEFLGLRPRWVDSTGVGGAAWEFMLEHAAAAIAVGQVDVVVLSYGSTTRADLKRGRRRANLNFGSSGPLQFEAPYGHALIAKYGMATQRHMYEFGTDIEQLA